MLKKKEKVMYRLAFKVLFEIKKVWFFIY